MIKVRDILSRYESARVSYQGGTTPESAHTYGSEEFFIRECIENCRMNAEVETQCILDAMLS